MTDKQLNKRLCVARALDILLMRYDVCNITIADVCRESGVPRATFYRLFYNLNDVSLWLFEYLLQNSMTQESIDRGWQAAEENLFSEMQHWKNLFYKFYQVQTYDSILEYASRSGEKEFLKYAAERLGREISAQERMVVAYHSYSQACLCAKWVKDGMVVPPAEMAALMVQFLPPIMKEFTKPRRTGFDLK